jgi:hypothetical protein
LGEVACDRIRADREWSERGGILQERGVTSSQVFAWKKRLREAEKAQFVEVQIKPAEPPREIGIRQQAKAIEVRLCGGRSIAVEPGFDADHLRALLAVLEPEA